MILADVIRRRAGALGCPLDHVDDDELGARLVAMPLEVTDDPRATAFWLAYGATRAEVLAVRPKGPPLKMEGRAAARMIDAECRRRGIAIEELGRMVAEEFGGVGGNYLRALRRWRSDGGAAELAAVERFLVVLGLHLDDVREAA